MLILPLELTGAVNLCTCIRCKENFEGRYPKSKICKKCTLRGMSRGESHWNYKHGKYIFETLSKEIKKTIGFCERCTKDLREATHYLWAVHHKNHDHFDHRKDNLELLCKRCHQIEHDCVSNFKIEEK